MSDDYWRNYNPVDAAMHIAGAPNRLAGGQMDTSDVIGAIPRPDPTAGLLAQLRDRAMRGDVGASGLMAQHDQAKAGKYALDIDGRMSDLESDRPALAPSHYGEARRG